MCSEFQVPLTLFQWICKCRNKPKLCLYTKQSKEKRYKQRTFPGLFHLFMMSFHLTYLFENQNMKGCVLPVPHSTAVSKGEEMNVFLFSYYFCPDSNISWPTLDTDLSRHFSFVPLPLFQFPNPYFALQSVAGRLLLCAQKPQECGRVTDHTPHTCWYFYEIGSVIFNPTCQQRKMTSSVVTILKIPCPFPRESEENCSCLWGKTKIQMSMCCSEMKLGGQSHCPQTQKPKVFIW